MTATASARTFDPFLSPDLLATRDPNTARLCATTWMARLEMGVHSALQLAQDLHSETLQGSPREETIVALYQKLTSLSATHPARESSTVNGRTVVPAENALAEPLTQAVKTVEGWYIDAVKATQHSADRNEKRPTPEVTHTVREILQNLVSQDLQAIARPHIERYNSGCKPGQVFVTPLELLGPGAPLEWQTGKVTDTKPYQVFDTPTDLFEMNGPLAWQRAGKN